MKNYRVAAQYEQNKLFSLFKDIHKVFEMEGTDQYTHISISVFDHWLSETEALKAFNRVTRMTQQKRRDALHDSFLKALLNQFKVYEYTYIEYQQEYGFVKYLSEDEHLKFLSAHEKNTFCIVIPQIKALLFSGFDDTNHLYYQDEKLLDEIRPLVKKAHLWMI